MPRGRHSLAPNTVRSHRIALVAAPLVTALAVAAGVALVDLGPSQAPSATGNLSAGGAKVSAGTTPSRTLGTSRSLERVPLVDNRVPKAKGQLWTTEALDLRVQPSAKSKVAGELEAGKRVAVTGRRQAGYAEVIVGDLTRWVTADYLSKDKSPVAEGLSDAPCPDGSSIESALQPQSVKVYRAVCAAFPELSSYGGQDGHGEHVNGEAIDFMVPSSSVGQRVADFLYAHRVELDLFDIIWSRSIWTVERSGEGFRSMSSRGSATADHMDHVHMKIN